MNETKQLLLAQQNAQIREHFLAENDLRIRRCASKAAGRFVDYHDDAYSEALIAFNDAITAYQPGKGSFYALAAAVIQNRVTDLLRRESRNAHCVPFSTLSTQDDHGGEIPSLICPNPPPSSAGQSVPVWMSFAG
jgi:RNA polymerase sigma factor